MLVAPIRRLWTPSLPDRCPDCGKIRPTRARRPRRYSPRDRIRHACSIAGDYPQVGSTDGYPRVKTDHPVVAGAGDPCCCTPPLNCDICGWGKPSVTVTFSGITICPCLVFSFGLPPSAVMVGEPNGTWVLPATGVGTTCNYQAIIPGITRQLHSSNSDCTGTVTADDAVAVTVVIATSGTTMSVSVGYGSKASFPGYCSNIFTGGVVVDPYSCSTRTWTITNAIAACAPAGSGHSNPCADNYGYGGSVVITVPA